MPSRGRSPGLGGACGRRRGYVRIAQTFIKIQEMRASGEAAPSLPMAQPRGGRGRRMACVLTPSPADRQDIAARLRPAGVVGHPAATGHWHDPSIKPAPFDLAKANQLLDQAGYKNFELSMWDWQPLESAHLAG